QGGAEIHGGALGVERALRDAAELGEELGHGARRIRQPAQAALDRGGESAHAVEVLRIAAARRRDLRADVARGQHAGELPGVRFAELLRLLELLAELRDLALVRGAVGLQENRVSLALELRRAAVADGHAREPTGFELTERGGVWSEVR